MSTITAPQPRMAGHLRVLSRRADHLQQRINESNEKVLSNDVKELQAIRWVVSTLSPPNSQPR